MINPTEYDIGRKVIYKPMHADDFEPPDCEEGIITSFNDRFVFVRYHGITSAGTRRKDLFWL